MKKLIAIVGMSGSGKSIASDYLEEKGYNKIYFGGVVLEKVQEAGFEVNPENEKMIREKLRKEYGMAAMAIVLLPKIKESVEEHDTVLDGLYSWDELVVLRKEFGEHLKLICVNCDREVRYSRVAQRKIRPLNREEIEKRDIAEIENLAKGGPIAMADYFIFNNDGFDTYYERLDEIISDIEEKGSK